MTSGERLTVASAFSIGKALAVDPKSHYLPLVEGKHDRTSLRECNKQW
jgi:hypothetical protein